MSSTPGRSGTRPGQLVDCSRVRIACRDGAHTRQRARLPAVLGGGPPYATFVAGPSGYNGMDAEAQCALPFVTACAARRSAARWASASAEYVSGSRASLPDRHGARHPTVDPRRVRNLHDGEGVHDDCHTTLGICRPQLYGERDTDCRTYGGLPQSRFRVAAGTPTPLRGGLEGGRLRASGDTPDGAGLKRTIVGRWFCVSTSAAATSDGMPNSCKSVTANFSACNVAPDESDPAPASRAPVQGGW